MPRKLTDKQEAYKNNRIKGMGVMDSYKDAYNTSKMNSQTISKEANKLENDPRIAPFIKAKKEEATERALVTVEDVVKGLLLEATTNGEGSTQGARVTAWKHLSEFTGGFDANRLKVDMNTEVTFNMSFGGDDDD